jgi:hypothetical protein
MDAAWCVVFAEATRKLKGVLPPVTLISDSRLLTDKQLQTELFMGPGRDQIVEFLNNVSKIINGCKVLAERGVRFSAELKALHTSARALKQFAKGCVGVDHALSIITELRSDDPKVIHTTLVEVQDKIRAGSLPIPEWLVLGLQAMVDASAGPDDQEAEGEEPEGEGVEDVDAEAEQEEVGVAEVADSGIDEISSSKPDRRA